MKRSAVVTMAALVGAFALVACNEDSLSGPGFICDVTNPVRDVFISPSAPRIVVHTPALASDTVHVVGTATDRLGGTRTDVPIGYSSSDTTIATVDAAGTVHAKRPGTAKITASVCGESSSTQVTIVASVARVTITPALDTVLTGDSVTFTAHAFGADNSSVPGTKFTFAGSPASIATVVAKSDSSVTVTGSAGGTATITATGEGVTANAGVLVLPRLFLAGSTLANTIDAGDATGCGIINLGRAFCWGLSNHGQIGARTDSVCFDDNNPDAVVNDSLKSTALPCSLHPRSISADISFTTISAGDSTGCAISVAGRAYCWGAGVHGEVGNGATADKSSPVLVTSALTFTSISVGGSHACAIATGGVAYCWGSDVFGQLGDARLVNSTTPIPVATGAGVLSFASISAGYRHTCGVTSAGVGYCWGNNDFGQLGDGTNARRDTPVQVAANLTFSFISAGGDHTCGITTGGAAFCWGDNTVGQLGIGSVGGTSNTPVTVVGAPIFTRISASTGTKTVDTKGLFFKALGRGHTCGLTATGAVFCWGDDTDLQLGRGQFTGGNGTSGVPVQVSIGERPTSATFTSVTTGSRQSCGVATDGNAYCWGSNVLGGLGNTLQAAFRGQPQRVATPR